LLYWLWRARGALACAKSSAKGRSDGKNCLGMAGQTNLPPTDESSATNSSRLSCGTLTTKLA
jgi:hypothetical protein